MPVPPPLLLPPVSSLPPCGACRQRSSSSGGGRAATAADAALPPSWPPPPLPSCRQAADKMPAAGYRPRRRRHTSRRAAATSLPAALPPSCCHRCQAGCRCHCRQAAAAADAALPPSYRHCAAAAAASALPLDDARTIAPQLGSPHGGDDPTLHHSRWPIGGSRRLPGNGRRSCCKCINARLLATIHSHRPRRRGCRSASHDGIADRAPGLAQNAVTARDILVGIGTRSALPCDDLGRRRHCFADKFLGS